MLQNLSPVLYFFRSLSLIASRITSRLKDSKFVAFEF